MAVRSEDLDVVPAGGCLGAEIRGIDLADAIPAAAFAWILARWTEHLVLLFRGQRLDDRQLIAFSRRFGELDECPPNDLGRHHIEALPEIVVISNVKENGRKIGSLGNSEADWHTDMSFQETPPKASLLYALEVPFHGGDTSFVDMYRALETLPAPLRRQIEGVSIVHDAIHDSTGNVRKNLPAGDAPGEVRGARHPVIRTHPQSGRPALFLGRRRGASIVGYSAAASDRLLDRLWAHATRPEFAWTHRWRPGDLVLWDNRCTMHRRDGFPAERRRVMHRTQVKGEAVGSPSAWNRVAAG